MTAAKTLANIIEVQIASAIDNPLEILAMNDTQKVIEKYNIAFLNLLE